VFTKGEITRHEKAAAAAFLILTGEELAHDIDHDSAVRKAFGALGKIDILKPHFDGKGFHDVDVGACVTTTKLAEGGADRERLQKLLRERSGWDDVCKDVLTENDKEALLQLAKARDTEVVNTSGTLLRDLYKASFAVLQLDSWPDKTLCPSCEQRSAKSLLESIAEKLEHYSALEEATNKIAAAWGDKNWRRLLALETKARSPDQPSYFADADRTIASASLTAAQVEELWTWRGVLLTSARAKVAEIDAERAQIEKRLPRSLVEVAAALDAARRLQESWTEIARVQADLEKLTRRQAGIARVKKFLSAASDAFAQAEAAASARRLAAVSPVFQDYFASIMADAVKPALTKPAAGEELTLVLSEFWSLQNVSAQALLSESFRNAFAVSVYLAAACLYGGAPKFVVLDDVTSSFDAGHQFHLMELIRTKFARPVNPNGPQVILLSHDTLLEKYFNKNGNTQGWKHQRLEGTPRTAVLALSNPADRIRTAIGGFLQAGRVEDASHRIRQYLEHRLLHLITKLQIPVPIDFALDDHKKQVQAAIDAINAAVALHQAAGSLILEPTQVVGLQPNMATITGNFLAHYPTGATGAFSATALKGVMAAIDAYEDCFRYEDPPGSGNRRFYRNLSNRA